MTDATPYRVIYRDSCAVIYHGRAEDIIPNIEADVMVTDPPYGFAYASNKTGKFQGRGIANDHDTSTRDAVLELWGMKPALIFGSWKAPRPALTKNVLVWDKLEWVGMGDLSAPWGFSHEEIYVMGEGFTTTGKRQGSVVRYQNVVSWSGRSGQRQHPNEKPLGLMRDLVSKCPPGVIVDPFMGSGTTLRACKDLGRLCVGIDVERSWCDVAVSRLAQEALNLDGAA